MTLRDQILSKQVKVKEQPYQWEAFDCDVLLGS